MSEEEEFQQARQAAYQALGRLPDETDAEIYARVARYGLWLVKTLGRNDGDERTYTTDITGEVLSLNYLAPWRSLTVIHHAREGATVVEMCDRQDDPRASNFLATRYGINEVRGRGQDPISALIAVKTAYDRMQQRGPSGSIDPATGAL